MKNLFEGIAALFENVLCAALRFTFRRTKELVGSQRHDMAVRVHWFCCSSILDSATPRFEARAAKKTRILLHILSYRMSFPISGSIIAFIQANFSHCL